MWEGPGRGWSALSGGGSGAKPLRFFVQLDACLGSSIDFQKKIAA
jgi:hypothetical protein